MSWNLEMVAGQCLTRGRRGAEKGGHLHVRHDFCKLVTFLVHVFNVGCTYCYEEHKKHPGY